MTKLTVELVPKSSWGINARSLLKSSQWDNLRKECYHKANYHCEICTGKGNAHPVETHEIWEFDEVNHIQKLTGLIALCPSCHLVKHIGRAEATGQLGRAIAHLKKVNGWSKDECDRHLEQAWKTWEARSFHNWQVDISALGVVK